RLPELAPRARAPVVRAVRGPRTGPPDALPRVPAAGDRAGARPVPVRGTGEERDPPPEVRGVAGCGGGAGSLHGGRRGAVGSGRDLGHPGPERGFDQARALAEVVGSRLHLPVARLLVRTTDTGSQARRSGPMRRAAMAGAFESAGQPPPLVLLVDDVLTTGATAAACARTLLDAGASRVRLLTAARALA